MVAFRNTPAGGFFLLFAFAALPPSDDPTRGITRVEISSGTRYVQKWAVVVGIDYRVSERAKLEKAGNITELKNAERDARELAERLISDYGYDKNNVILLTGENATKVTIDEKFRES